MYKSSSEFVNSAHPDRVADNLAAIVINDIQKHDGAHSHAAIEVFLTHDTVIFSGEATTSLKINKRYLRSVVEKGFIRSGYFPEMRKFWKKSEVVLAKDLKIKNNIFAQSPDIALGTTDKGKESGWNDQGIYFSSADNSTEQRIGYPMYVAQLIGDHLRHISEISIKQELPVVLGPDIKVVVTCRVEVDGFTPKEVTAITIAQSHASKNTIQEVRDTVRNEIEAILRASNVKVSPKCEWVINGTGRFVVHGCISDTSMTGRKISVNHPSAGPLWSNKMIGGGSLVKPFHASDLILNLAARYIAKTLVDAGVTKYAIVGCAGAIGQHGVQSLFIRGDYKFNNSKKKDAVQKYFEQNWTWSPYWLASKFGFFTADFDFGKAVDMNFFGDSNSQPWETPSPEDIQAVKEIFE